MRSYEDNYTLVGENRIMQVAIRSILGDRDEQQDCSGFHLLEDEGYVVICDGMGGHSGGKIASNLAVDETLKKYSDVHSVDEIKAFLVDNAKEIDRKIAAIKTQEGKPLLAGTTIVSVLVRKEGLFWFSAGDSRAYIFRNDEHVQLTTDHNYMLALAENVKMGMIDQSMLETEKSKGDTLISFLGVGNLNIMDVNDLPMRIIKNDTILLTTDGLYRLLTDEQIVEIVSNFKNPHEITQALENKALKISKAKNVSKDNITFAVLKIK